MARQSGPNELPELHDPTLLPGLDQATAIRVGERDFTVAKTLRDVHLRALTGASVVAIRRADDPVTLSTGNEQLEAGDVLAVVGTQDAIARARALLAHGPEALAKLEAGG